MHEAMVAESLLDSILAEAKKQKAKPILVKISCGTFNVINDEVLGLAFTAIAKDTLCEDVKLEVEHKTIRGQCTDCNRQFEFELVSPNCPDCASKDFALLPDAPLLLETIEFETE